MAKIVIRPEDIVKVVAANPAVASNAMDYFKRRPCKNTTYAVVDDIQKQTGNIPVIRRGDKGYRPKSSRGRTIIEPMPIEIDDSFDAGELEDYERASNRGKQQLIQDKLAQHLEMIRNTTKALAIQAHLGKIDYMMQTASGLERYEVDYGSIGKITSSNTMSGLTIAKLVTEFNDAVTLMNNNHVAGAVEWIASSDLFTAIVNAAAGQSAYDVKVQPGVIIIGGFKVLLDNDSYSDVNSSGQTITKTMLGEKQLLTRAVNAGQSMPYYKLDDVKMREAVPFYSFTAPTTDQRGIDIFSKSKPLPLVNPKGIVLTTFK